jgi:hypothetical protein
MTKNISPGALAALLALALSPTASARIPVAIPTGYSPIFEDLIVFYTGRRVGWHNRYVLTPVSAVGHGGATGSSTVSVAR